MAPPYLYFHRRKQTLWESRSKIQDHTKCGDRIKTQDSWSQVWKSFCYFRLSLPTRCFQWPLVTPIHLGSRFSQFGVTLSVLQAEILLCAPFPTLCWFLIPLSSVCSCGDLYYTVFLTAVSLIRMWILSEWVLFHPQVAFLFCSHVPCKFSHLHLYEMCSFSGCSTNRPIVLYHLNLSTLMVLSYLYLYCLKGN